MKQSIQQITISPDTSIIDAMRKMDDVSRKLLIVAEEENSFIGLVSIGDIQRAIISNKSLDTPVKSILRSDIKVSSIHEDKQDIINYMKQRRNDFMPILDDDKNVVDVLFWNDIFEKDNKNIKHKFDIPVVIMAGGKGTRLQPLTNVLPKPLIPIGNQTMIEDIMDRFVDCGCNTFYISVNYKADTIKHYLDNLTEKHYNIDYFQETKPLGTAGSLHLLSGKIKSTFFVSNCDIIIDEDYSEILDYHRINRNEITIVAAMKNYAVPYGTLETGDNGCLRNLQEKPNLTFKINTGMYILESDLLKEIPTNAFYHITTLIEKLVNQGRRVGVFPVSEGSWTDVGNWNEYLKYINND